MAIPADGSYAHVPAVHAQNVRTGEIPDITYNPNPNTNIPYSTHSIAQAKADATSAAHATINTGGK